MNDPYTRLTLIAHRGRSEIVVTLRRRGRRQTVLLDGQLVCSRAGTTESFTLGPAAGSFDPSLLRNAIDQLASTIGHPIHAPGDSPEPPRDRQADSQVELPVLVSTAGPVAHRCERCSSSMIYEGSARPQIRLCPSCQAFESTQRAQGAGLVVKLISTKLSDHVCANRRQLTESALESFQEQLRQLQAIGDKLCGVESS